jgi:hypothetical protein
MFSFLIFPVYPFLNPCQKNDSLIGISAGFLEPGLGKLGGEKASV